MDPHHYVSIVPCHRAQAVGNLEQGLCPSPVRHRPKKSLTHLRRSRPRRRKGKKQLGGDQCVKTQLFAHQRLFRKTSPSSFSFSSALIFCYCRIYSFLRKKPHSEDIVCVQLCARTGILYPSIEVFLQDIAHAIARGKLKKSLSILHTISPRITLICP